MRDSDPDRQIWFPAKRYGWGWGLPCAWQGWVFMIAWLAVFLAGTLLLVRPPYAPGFFAGFLIVMVAVLVAVCWLKGDPPRWRWGGD